MSYVSMLGAFNLSVQASASAKGRTLPAPARPGESLVDGGNHPDQPSAPAPVYNYAPPANMGTPGMMYTAAPVPKPTPVPGAAALFEKPYTIKAAPGPSSAATGSRSGALLVFGILGAVAVVWLVTREK